MDAFGEHDSQYCISGWVLYYRKSGVMSRAFAAIAVQCRCLVIIWLVRCRRLWHGAERDVDDVLDIWATVPREISGYGVVAQRYCQQVGS